MKAKMINESEPYVDYEEEEIDIDEIINKIRDDLFLSTEHKIEDTRNFISKRFETLIKKYLDLHTELPLLLNILKHVESDINNGTLEPVDIFLYEILLDKMPH